MKKINIEPKETFKKLAEMRKKYLNYTYTGGTAEPIRSSPSILDPLFDRYTTPKPVQLLTDLQQCIKDCLRLATFARQGPYNDPSAELNRLATLIEKEVQKELNAWKTLMGSESAKEAIDVQIKTITNSSGLP